MLRRLAAVLLAVLALGAGGVAAQTLPPDIAQSKKIRVAVNGSYPPMESVDVATNKLVGFDIDLGEALAKTLGVELEWQDGSFAQLIPSLQSSRADMILSGISDLPARRESLNFIDYLNSGAQFYTLAKNTAIKSPADLCGVHVGTVRSTSFPANIAQYSAENCEKLGKPAIIVDGVDRMPLVATELQQGRIDAAVRGSETLPTMMRDEPDTYRIVTPPFTKVYQGIAFLKTNTALQDAVLVALNKLFADGTYTALIQKWHLEASAAPAPTVNGEPPR
ncbi:MAG TPA: ABC transporter substrate-binding protein [Stellaceae bacterium]|nr:ABC transporter substrate-binding protein [Stellaceae bacterium]